MFATCGGAVPPVDHAWSCSCGGRSRELRSVCGGQPLAVDVGHNFTVYGINSDAPGLRTGGSEAATDSFR